MKKQLTPELRQKVHALWAELIQSGMPVDRFDTAIEIRVGLASAVGALAIKLKSEVFSDGPYCALMAYLCEATDEELLTFKEIKVKGGAEQGQATEGLTTQGQGFQIDLSLLDKKSPGQEGKP